MAARKTRLLIAEDDPAIVELLRWTFERDGFEVAHTPSGEEALLLVAECPPDIIILDWMIEEVSGIEVCRRLRRTTAGAGIPIIMLTARAEEVDRIRGLDTGADDYVTKPFSPIELLARVNAVLRRVRPALAAGVLRYGDLELDAARHKVRRSGVPIPLGPTEFRLLRYFIERPGHVLARDQLLDAVWGHDTDIELRTVDVYIRRLRKALNAEGKSDILRTVRSAGYALDLDK
jgi:two-component system phosphate regulon response regulator PhoB